LRDSFDAAGSGGPDKSLFRIAEGNYAIELRKVKESETLSTSLLQSQELML